METNIKKTLGEVDKLLKISNAYKGKKHIRQSTIETKEQKEARKLKTQNRVLELDRQHNREMRMITNYDWNGLLKSGENRC